MEEREEKRVKEGFASLYLKKRITARRKRANKIKEEGEEGSLKSKVLSQEFDLRLAT